MGSERQKTRFVFLERLTGRVVILEPLLRGQLGVQSLELARCKPLKAHAGIAEHVFELGGASKEK